MHYTYQRNGCEPRRVQQVPSDVFVDRDRRFTTSGASVGAKAAVIYQGPMPNRPNGADAAAQQSRGTGGGEDPPQRRGHPLSGRRKHCDARRRRVRGLGIRGWGAVPAAGSGTWEVAVALQEAPDPPQAFVRPRPRQAAARTVLFKYLAVADRPIRTDRVALARTPTPP